MFEVIFYSAINRQALDELAAGHLISKPYLAYKLRLLFRGKRSPKRHAYGFATVIA